MSECVTIDEIQDKHIKSNKTIMLINEFENNFGDKIKNFFHENNKEFIFNFYYINSFCDHLLSNILELSDLSNLKKYIYDIEELNNYCKIIS